MPSRQPESFSAAQGARDQSVSALVLYGVSESLLSLIDGVVESSTPRGRPRYTDKVVRELRQRAFCRNLNSVIWEWAHFAAAAEFAENGGLLSLLVSDSALIPSEFSALAKDWSGGQLQYRDGSVAWMFGDRPFVLHSGRVPLLLAFTELVIGMDYLAVDRVLRLFSTVDDGGFTAQLIDKQAATLQKAVRDYLDAHLQPQKPLKEARHWLAWMRAREEGRAIPNDGDVLDFWCEHWPLPEYDFRRYKRAAESALDYVVAYRRAATSMNCMDSISLDDVHFLESDTLSEALLETDERGGVIECLSQLRSAPLNAIKFLTAKDLDALAYYLYDGVACDALPISVVRIWVFGARQAQITGDFQNNAGLNLSELLSCVELLPPDTQITELQALSGRLLTARRAVAYVLSQCSDEIHLAGEALQLAESAWKKNNRQGFKYLPEIEQLSDYEHGDECLATIQYALDQAIERAAEVVQQLSLNDAASAQRECLQFEQQFNKMYGAAS